MLIRILRCYDVIVYSLNGSNRVQRLQVAVDRCLGFLLARSHSSHIPHERILLLRQLATRALIALSFKALDVAVGHGHWSFQHAHILTHRNLRYKSVIAKLVKNDEFAQAAATLTYAVVQA